MKMHPNEVKRLRMKMQFNMQVGGQQQLQQASLDQSPLNLANVAI